MISADAAITVIDRAAVLARMDGDEDMLREIVGLFLEYAPQRRDEIRRATHHGDLASLRRTIHAFKGSVGYLEGDQVLEALRQLDQLAIAAEVQLLPQALLEFERRLEEFTRAAAALGNATAA